DGSSLLFVHMFFTTEARAQAERKMGGPATQNLDHTYRLSTDDTAYLASLGVDALPLVADMNAHRIYGADRSARRYMERFGGLNGDIKKPLLSMHAIHDGLATVDHEHVYRDLVREADKEDLLLQVYTDGTGHCHF